MDDERVEFFDLEKERFKMAMIAASPSRAKEIIEMFEAAENGTSLDGVERYEVPKLTGPLSAGEVDAALEELRTFGISLRPVEHDSTP